MFPLAGSIKCRDCSHLFLLKMSFSEGQDVAEIVKMFQKLSYKVSNADELNSKHLINEGVGYMIICYKDKCTF